MMDSRWGSNTLALHREERRKRTEPAAKLLARDLTEEIRVFSVRKGRGGKPFRTASRRRGVRTAEKERRMKNPSWPNARRPFSFK